MNAFRIFLILILCGLQAACTQRSVRVCEGFNHPLAEVWTENNGLGEVRRFVNQNNEETMFVLESTTRTEPGAMGSDRGDNCLSSAEYKYVQSDADIAFKFDFIQSDNFDEQPFEDQRVQLVVLVENPVGIDTDESILIRFELTNFSLNNLEIPPDIIPIRDVMYLPELTINGVTHFDILQHTWLDNSERFLQGNVVEQAQWVRMLLIKDIGLFQYELLNGDIYTLAR